MTAKVKAKGAPASSWAFSKSLRKGAFGWRSSALAIKRIKEAISEIRAVAKKDPALAGQGAVLFLEKVVPAIADVDSSSGALGSAVRNAGKECASFVEQAAWTPEERMAWLERLYESLDDGYGYFDHLGDEWGRMCATPEIASKWAETLAEPLRFSWKRGGASYFHGTSACLSSFRAAKRYNDIFELLNMPQKVRLWHDRRFGFLALMDQGKLDEALGFAQDYLNSDVTNRTEAWVYRDCEEALRTAGRFEEAYEKCALETHASNTNIGTFRSIAKDYPGIDRGRILRDLIEQTSPEGRGKWFATAKELGEYTLALDLVSQAPCDPMTLTRAAADHADSNTEFALGAGVAAMRWLCAGYGYEISNVDVVRAYQATLQAAARLRQESAVTQQIRNLIHAPDASKFVADSLAMYLR